MPRKLKIDGLDAEILALDSLITQANEAGDQIAVFQLSKRKESLKLEIDRISKVRDKLASVALFFGGDPVIGSRGISAEFAGKALEEFQELVSRTFAKAELGTLGKRGPIPLKSATKLMVTEITRGSFGFILDELSDQEEIEDTELNIMVDEVVNIITKTASPNDPDFEEIVVTLDDRTLIALKDFFVTLDSNNATLRLVEGSVDFTLDEPSIQRGRARTEATSIDETDDFVTGKLIGFLPEHKKFEIQLDDNTITYGSVSKEASKQFDEFIAAERMVISKKWRLKIHRRTVRPLNRSPREVIKMLEFVEEII
ncbi:hypothetical protein KAR91_14050 [Candidatus Pacearchaeota archaeon]|nr:hypothetical protein [Candidatus Pacearchaeota archaeon]